MKSTIALTKTRRMKPSPPRRAAATDRWKRVRSSTLISLICSLAAFIPHRLESASPQYGVPVIINPDQTITYQPTPKGDRISDFSTVGYNYGNSPLPNEPGGYQVPVIVTLPPQSGDQTDRIQAPASTQLALLVETTALDAEFEDRTCVVVPAAGGPASPRAFLRFVVNH